MKCANLNAGFTLLETLLSLALTALIIGMLSIIGRQWLMEWRTGFSRVEELDHVELAKDRITTDLQASLSLPAGANASGPRFIGDASRVIFVREPFLHDKTDRLVVVEYSSDLARGVVRRTAVYDSTLPLEKLRFGEPVAVLPLPYIVTFSYRDADGRMTENWSVKLPPETITFALSHTDKAISWVAPVSRHATLPSSCAAANSRKQCRVILQQQASSNTEPNLKGNIVTDTKGAVTP